ncbi:MAG TPA: amidohydrolase family protein [Jatrophihabitantaceae bacterium]
MRSLYRNGRIYPGAARNATALIVDDGRIAWLGDDPASPADRVVDLDGALVTPAFVDAHIHATAAGLSLTGLELSGAESLRDALDRVERHNRSGRGRPVLGHGWDDTNWPEHRPPTLAELDRAAYGGAVYLSRVDAHSAAVSSALLAATPGIRSLPGFRPDGWLTGEAHHAARRVAFGGLSAGQVRDAQRATLAHAATLGIGCLHEMAGPEVSSADDLAGLLALAGAEPGPDVIGYWGELFGIDTARELGAAGAAGDLFCDGSLGSHTAALGEPYADAPDTSGELHLGVDEIAEHVRRCTEAGLQAGFHAIGDAAVDAILDAVERLGTAAGSGHRVEHVEMVRSPARLAAAGLTASMQPAFDATWGGPHGMYAERLGTDRAVGLNRFAQLAAAGVSLAFGSDAPVTPLNPWAAVRAAAYPHVPDAAISAQAAFAAHTRGGWRAAGRMDGGVLDVGAPATFAVWPTGELTGTGLPDLAPGVALPTCVRTVVRGETIYEA